MARGFRRHRGRFVAKLDPDERVLVVGLLEHTRQLLLAPPAAPEPDEFDLLMLDAGMEDPDRFGAGPRLGGPDDAPEREPDDPAVRRLLPAGHHDDPHAAAEFRRLTGRGLRERKAHRLELAAKALRAAAHDSVSLEPDAAEDLLVGLTDVRLVLGERLELHTDADAAQLHHRLEGIGPHDTSLPLLVSYEFLTWLQESLAAAMLQRP
ncbi:MAG TPA: DUF2017 family protein [Dermatophilaceae bacterium]|nr:DUF2017 family protein [Dermatophilaceae bacterium]